jgi:hypothetical protein
MKTMIKLLAVLAIALATFSQHTTASAGGNFKFRGDGADAFFSSTDPSGCIFTDVFIFASDGIFQNPPGPSGASSGTDLFMFQYDACANMVLLDAFGFASLAGPDFQVFGKLDSATLNATVNMYDYVSDSFFDVFVDLAWMGNGPLVRQSSNSHFNSPGCKIHSRFRGTFRPAEVLGSISDGTTNFTPEPGGGTISSVKQGDLFIGCN